MRRAFPLRELYDAMRALTIVLVALGIAACGERSEAQNDAVIRATVEKLVPQVERAVGLPFKDEPVVALRSREQVREYLVAKLDTDLPPEVLEGMSAAYRLFGLLPDTLDLHALLLSLYTEQVVGYYDPDSVALYVVEGADRAFLRMVLAHEMVHALQGQYLPVDSLIAPDRSNDARMAAQAVLEGQATLASLTILMPDRDFSAIPNFWETYRESLKQQHAQMPVFSSAPAVIQEGIVFPYLEGANFVRWFLTVHPDTLPYGRYLPQSSEQVLHPDRYHEGDAPVELTLVGGGEPLYSDVLGEFETRILLAELLASESMARAGARDWGGDRYAVYDTPGGLALAWWSVWDDARAAERFATLLERGWARRERDGRTSRIERTAIDGWEAVVLRDGPVDWWAWDEPPTVTAPAPVPN
jgi:hypothetical protein